MVHQLFLQHSTRLNEQAAVNGLVGHAHALVVGITGLQPSGNLLRRPVQNQFTRNDVAQLTVYGKQTAFRPQRCVPCLLVRGRFYNDEDNEEGRRVAFLGSDTKKQLFAEREALGQTIELNGVPYTVIGVMRAKDQNSD